MKSRGADYEIEYNPGIVAEKRQNLGRFVLMTNDLDISPDELLANYKEQGAVERGFRFLKDPLFWVAKIFLKKPSRIQALAMIMVLWCQCRFTFPHFRRRKNTQMGRDKIPQLCRNKNPQCATREYLGFACSKTRSILCYWI